MSSGLMPSVVILDEHLQAGVGAFVVQIWGAFPDEEADVALGGGQGVAVFFDSADGHRSVPFKRSGRIWPGNRLRSCRARGRGGRDRGFVRGTVRPSPRRW